MSTGRVSAEERAAKRAADHARFLASPPGQRIRADIEATLEEVREEGRREVRAEWAAYKERNLLALTPQAIADDIDTTAMALVSAGQAMGRREVLREIARLSPCNVSSCTFCCGPYQIQTDTWVHASTCLWQRARTAALEEQEVTS